MHREGVASGGTSSHPSVVARARRRLVGVFSGGSAFLGVLLLPVFLYDVFDLTGTQVEIDSLVYAVVSGTAVQALIFLWVISGRSVRVGAASVIAIQTVTAVSVALIVRSNPMLCVSALMFAVIPIMLAGSVYEPGGVRWAAVCIAALDLAAGVVLAPLYGIFVLLPPLLVIVAGTFIIHTTAKVAFDLETRDAEHLCEERRLEHEVCTDELTGLLNRRGFMIAANNELDLARRQGVGVTVAYLDLDRMKDINDTHGHVHGDAALRDAANMVKRALRSSDLVARMGGDEFAVFAWELPDAEIAHFTARLEAAMEAYNAEHPGRVPVWLSYGIACSSADDTRSLDELLEVADDLMYEAKFANRVRRGLGGLGGV